MVLTHISNNLSLQCSGTGTASTCLTGSDKATPLVLTHCGDGTVGTLGECVKCSKDASAGTPGDGDGSAQGTCADSSHRCIPDGSCKCTNAAMTAFGNGMSQGTCAAGQCCCGTGVCVTAASCTTSC